MRPDGRLPDQLRPVRITPDYLAYAEGSAIIEMGETRVLCAVTIENRLPPWLSGQGKGWVTAEYALLPRSTKIRTPRETSGLGARTQEIRRLIGRALRAAVRLEQLGERTCIVDCDVLQADGGTRTAAITGGYVALRLALDRLIQTGELPLSVLGPAVAAVSVGLVEGEPRLDLSYAEDSVAEADLNVVLNEQSEFVEIQGTAEGRPFTLSELSVMLDLAQTGIEKLLALQREVLSR